MVSSIVVFDYFFKIKAGNFAVCVAIHTFYTIRLCRGFVGCWAFYYLVLIGDFVVEGILNVLPGLSLFTLVFICIMGACDFLSCSARMGDKFFSLSLMLFGGRIGDLCNGCFNGDFALLGVVRVGVIDPTCVFVWTTTLDLSPFQTCCWAGAW